MRCPACGGANLGDARFCCHCGVRLADAAPPASAAPSPWSASRRLVTMGGPEAHAIVLPMRGPTPRTLALAGIGIGVVGIALGATLALQATHDGRTGPRPTTSSSQHLALLAVPHVIGADAGPPVATDPFAIAPGPATTRSASSPHAMAALPRPHATAAANSHPRTSAPVAAAPAAMQPADPPIATSDPSAPAAVDDNPTAAATPATTTARTDATGTLDDSVIQSVYQQNRSRLEGCGLLLAGNSSNVGTVLVRVRLGADGRVLRTNLLGNTTSNTFLGQCVQNTIRGWRYPAPQGGEVEFEYRFGFGT